MMSYAKAGARWCFRYSWRNASRGKLGKRWTRNEDYYNTIRCGIPMKMHNLIACFISAFSLSAYCLLVTGYQLTSYWLHIARAPPFHTYRPSYMSLERLNTTLRSTKLLCRPTAMPHVISLPFMPFELCTMGLVHNRRSCATLISPLSCILCFDPYLENQIIDCSQA